jgi:hypothetical protein
MMKVDQLEKEDAAMAYELRKPRKTYANYQSYYLQVNSDERTFECGYAGRGAFLQGAQAILLAEDGSEEVLAGRAISTNWERRYYHADTRLCLTFTGEHPVCLNFVVSSDGIEMTADCPQGRTLLVRGRLIWGEDSFAVQIGGRGCVLRAGVGPAVSAADNALFDRADGSAAGISGAQKLQLAYDWTAGCHTFEAEGNRWKAYVQPHLFETLFATPYHRVNKHNTFPTPPVGWMTWYAVKFDACEKAVLENAAWQKEHLADFGANTIWVDWEWYHSALEKPGPEGIDFFHPDPVRYPHGLKFVADKIREMGLTPALWIGPTHEPALTEFIRENPDVVLAKELCWCGEYFFDLTNEKYLDGYLPAAIQRVKEWGFDAIKWDCLPLTLQMADQYHEYMKHPELTSEQALRLVIERARALLGDDFYMLSCSGEADRDVLFAADLFDGARIGGDIFTWQEFIDFFVARVLRFYPYHNTVLYCDPDNLVIRPEFNSMDQAISRASLVAVLGLPVTLGDRLPDLPPERVDLLRRCMPAMDAHPMDLRKMEREIDHVVVNLSISRCFEQWNVVDVLNLLEEGNRVTVDFHSDLHLEDGKYLVYDFWNREFLGVLEKSVTLELRACASRVIAVRKLQDVPQLVSTSRHISQGGVDLQEVIYDMQACVLRGRSAVVAGDPYEIRAYDPAQNRLVVREYLPECSGDLEWEIQF